jgi:hypothetical protein
MRSRQGSALFVDIAEQDLVTMELNWEELQHLMGNEMASAYVLVSPMITIWRWFDAHLDRNDVLVYGGWHGRRGWRVQYKWAFYEQAHALAPPAPVPTVVPTVEPTTVPTVVPTVAVEPPVEPTPAPTPPRFVLRWRDNFREPRV